MVKFCASMENPVTGNTSLIRKLMSLSTPASTLENGARVLSNGTWPDPILAMLAEIDDTVLRRRLSFVNGSTYLSVVAAGRRLVTVLDVSDNFSAASDILGKPLSVTETDIITSVAELLVEFASQEGRLLVKSNPAEATGHSTDAGVPVSMLEELMGVDLEAEPEDQLQLFIAASEEQMSSCIFYVDGEKVGEIGDAGEILSTQSVFANDWDAFREKLSFRKQGDTGPFLICLGNTLDNSTSLYIAQSGKSLAAFTSENDDAPALHENWGTYFVV